jgi:hypothetical protein
MKPAFAPVWLLCVVLPLAVVLLGERASGQVRVDLEFRRKLFVMYEPLIAVVTINNLSGRPLLLQSTDQHQWFGFNIEAVDGRLMVPVNPNYVTPPAAIGPGERMTRSVNLTPLFPLHDFGAYRVRAAIWVEEFGRYFSSPPLNVEITDGRPIWQEVVGVPGESGAPELRTITLLSHKLSRSTRLYARIENRERGRVYATHQLGPFLTFGRPEVMLDADNGIHILQNSSPKQFIYTHLNLDGEIMVRQAYREAGSRPSLAKQAGGSVAVAGGRPFTPGEDAESEGGTDRLGDRPVPLPDS